MVRLTEKLGPWASASNGPVREFQRTCTWPGPKSRPLKLIWLPAGPLVWPLAALLEPSTRTLGWAEHAQATLAPPKASPNTAAAAPTPRRVNNDLIISSSSCPKFRGQTPTGPSVASVRQRKAGVNTESSVFTSDTLAAQT